MQERIEEQETALREWENKLGCSGAGKAPHVVDVILGRIRSLTNELALQREALELGIECPYVDLLRAPEMPADIVLLLPMHKGGVEDARTECRTWLKTVPALRQSRPPKFHAPGCVSVTCKQNAHRHAKENPDWQLSSLWQHAVAGHKCTCSRGACVCDKLCNACRMAMRAANKKRKAEDERNA